jgi:hypothetical protein
MRTVGGTLRNPPKKRTHSEFRILNSKLQAVEYNYRPMADKRQGGDRRRRPRGGRRPDDVRGFTPLVMVVDSEARRRDISEAILAKLMFAVAPVESADKAIAVLKALSPEVIVAGEQDAQRLRELVPADENIAIISVGEEARVNESLIEEVRRSLQARVES